MSRKSELFAELTRIGVVAVVREDDPRNALEVARACIAGGAPIIEITFTTPDAVRILEQLAAENGEGKVLLAAGSLRTTEDAAAARNAGASILVSPHTAPAIIDFGLQNDLLVIAGAATPTEIIRAWEGGADLVKVYPALHLGGPDYIRTIRQPIRDIPMVVGGPVSLDAIEEYFDAGAVAINLGTSLAIPELVAAHDWGGIARRASLAVATAMASRERDAAAWPIH
jgi:2-dehydro-3-deoxyphosphogluconate aldolase/(4S)-4-hydroxy-2-oxoglutarate aldolase